MLVLLLAVGATADATSLMFGTSYGDVSGSVVVSSHSGTNVVAPGTKGDANMSPDLTPISAEQIAGVCLWNLTNNKAR
ncbi:MAG: hypothetical protein J1F68_00515 [Clostridiales bacterium]|nr:hypothetical protein [Clostridiales bacterium]